MYESSVVVRSSKDVINVAVNLNVTPSYYVVQWPPELETKWNTLHVDLLLVETLGLL